MYPMTYQIKNKNFSKTILYQLTEVLAKHRKEITRLRDTKNEKSKKIEFLLKNDLQKLGFNHSVTNESYPLFKKGSMFEVDFYHPDLKVAIEIEKSNLYSKVWLALYKQLESKEIKHGIILVPTIKHSKSKVENTFELTYQRIINNSINLLSNIESLTIIGY